MWVWVGRGCAGIIMLLDVAVAVLPGYSYYCQLAEVRRSRSLGSFSLYVCAIALVANLLRVVFWVLVGFEVSLLVQSVLVIAVMLMLLRECVELSDSFVKRTSLWGKFWQWETYQEYVRFLLWLAGGLAVGTLVLQVLTLGSFGQLVGVASLGLEATLGLPQLYSSWRAQSVKGVSLAMVAVWFLGDFGKTIYFIMRAQPFQFLLCGVIQLFIDILLLVQMVSYRQEADSAYSGLSPELPE